MTAEQALRGAIDKITADARMNAGIAAMVERRAEYPSADAMMLAGIAAVPEARQALDDALGRYWELQSGNLPSSRTVGEVIIGSGPHAAIYAATRVRMGFPKPLVLERSERPGGSFAMSGAPSFFLNSGNRPGLVGLPSNGQALNVLPGAPIQPADVSMREYQTNADIAFVTRVTLAMYATVAQGVNVEAWRIDAQYPLALDLADGRQVFASRVIDARGLGDPRTVAENPRVMTFPQFAGTFDGTFPLRGMRRVAVVGGGDSAKCTVEGLLGIGPSSGMSTAALDYVQTVDWYGNVERTCNEWLRVQRKRYARIGAYLDTGRLNVRRTGRATVVPSLDSVLVDGQSYDAVITATGYTLPGIRQSGFDDYGTFSIGGSGFAVARKANDAPVFRVGPAANLSFTDRENDDGVGNRPENRVALFRYAPRTATLAAGLPAA